MEGSPHGHVLVPAVPHGLCTSRTRRRETIGAASGQSYVAARWAVTCSFVADLYRTAVFKCAEQGVSPLRPWGRSTRSSLMLDDALLAAQTVVVAAESMGSAPCTSVRFLTIRARS